MLTSAEFLKLRLTLGAKEGNSYLTNTVFPQTESGPHGLVVSAVLGCVVGFEDSKGSVERDGMNGRTTVVAWQSRVLRSH
mmetsp:Transcript_919/g.2647  ORF Transcript_919/g.2647 Transcript_919/m.2647 type:complete len:80 (+) Transcript_919:1759-1998(+)